MTDQTNTLHILGTDIALGESREINFNVAKLHTQATIDVPVIIERSNTPGPTVLFTAGIHGDEVNGVEIVRQLIAKGINKPKRGTIICIPVINMLGFLNKSRELPDGRDLNRVFPGHPKGSLASQVAYKLINDIVPQADLIIDYHTGSADRFNSAHIRIVKDNEPLKNLADVFGAPFIMYSKNLKKSFRSACSKLNIPMLLFEGGKSYHLDNTISNTGVNGAKRILKHLNMLNVKFKSQPPKHKCVIISESKWIRAKHSGMFRATVKLNTLVEKGTSIGVITDPFGKFSYAVKSSSAGYLFNINEAPLVHQGDALFHISTQISE